MVQMGVAVEGLWLALTKDPLAMSLMSAAQGDMDVQPVDIHNKIFSAALSIQGHHTLLLKFCFVPTIATCKRPL